LPRDAGAAGAWQKIRKLQTTASAMHTTAHPDDEHGGMLALLSRGRGARVSLLTLTRGESGDNAIGPELFDAVGLIRTEELLQADKYYGVDRQYFTTAVDYGFSKRLDEALEKWGKDDVLRDVVRIIRMDRPLVIVSRFQGNERDGHGNHQAAGLITQEAFKAAGDPAMFPEQLTEGLRPWQPLKLYMGGVRENEPWNVRLDTGEYDPVLGDSYQNFARLGLGFQRSQNGGVVRLQPGPSIAYYRRLQSVVTAPDKETRFFDGIDTTIPGLYRALRKEPPSGAAKLLDAIDREVSAAAQAFTLTQPSAAAPALARALGATRAAVTALGRDPDVAFVLKIKEAQIQDALGAALGIDFTARAQRTGTKEPSGPFAAFAAPATMGAVVPGQAFEVRTSFTNPSSVPLTNVRVVVTADEGWTVDGGATGENDARDNVPSMRTFRVTVPATAALTKPYFSRRSIQDARYVVGEPSSFSKPSGDPPIRAVATYSVGGVEVETRIPVTHLEPNLPYGNETRTLAVVPAIGVTVAPSSAVVPLDASIKKVQVRAELVNNREEGAEGTLALKLPEGWRADPATAHFQFARAGERTSFPFVVTIPALDTREYRIEAIATAGGASYTEGYDLIQHRDLETRYLYRPASIGVRGVDVKIAPGLRVGYVMGIGDDVPAAIAQLGATVQLLGQADLADGDLAQFNAIVTGTRAYAVREDLKTYNRRLLDYVRNGGNLIVLYNTPEFDPKQYAPFPAALPANAEEVSEEDAPVTILAPHDPVFTVPNQITRADFDGWVEQRGSKFWSTWDPAYTSLIETHDRGQAPQKGGWLHARYGKGHYTYCAYAFHRQLPYGVPGAFRLIANLLSR
jgi:LmbE family N-acetylglucosaminyl deacetylase